MHYLNSFSRYLFGAALLIAPLHSLAESPHEAAQQHENRKSFSNDVTPGDFVPVGNSRFHAFVVKRNVDFSIYDEILFFPATFDRMKLSDEASTEMAVSWQKSSWKEMDRICEQFDMFARQLFKRNKEIRLTNRGGDNVYAVEFRIMEFMPTVVRNQEALLDTVGDSYIAGNLGVLGVRAVIANAKTGELLGVIEDAIQLSSSHSMRHSRTSEMLIWRQAFKDWVKNLRGELEMLQEMGYQEKESRAKPA